MIELPKNLTIRLEMGVGNPASTDLLSHVLAQIRLAGDQVYSCSLPPESHMELQAEAAHICIVTEGTLHVESDACRTVVIDTGDLVMLPRGAGDLRLAASGGPVTALICRFRFDPDSLPGMLSALPQSIHIRQAEGAGWLEGIVHFLLIEASDIQPGAALMVSRLIDLVVIRTLRSWIHRGPPSGWLGGLSDLRIASVLKAIHERPMQRWSIEALAAIAGMSRSSFCERFTTLVGRSPLRYHNEWRLALARDLLARRGARVGEIGFSIGYASEAAFSRAYKAQFGHSPRVEHRLHKTADR
jgi:AraC-like DNA-binding protein